MKLLIAVPSKNRIETLLKNTYGWLHYIVQNENLDWKIFVEPQDYDEYVKWFRDINVVSLDENNKGLGYAKAFIKDYAVKNGFDLVFKMDDDVVSWTNMRDRFKDDREASDNLVKHLEGIVPLFDKHKNLGAVAFPYGNELYNIFTPFLKTKRLQSSYIVRTKYLSVDPEINVFEDFATGLNILVDNSMILRYCYSAQVMGVRVGAGTGGHQSYDRKEQALKEIELLRKIYPPLKFRKVDKPWAIEPDIKSINL